MSSFKSIPLAQSQQNLNKFDGPLPKGRQFWLMAPYQRNRKQKLASLLGVILLCSPALFLLYRVHSSAIRGVAVPIFCIVSMLTALLLLIYSCGHFDHSEQWLTYLLIINKANDADEHSSTQRAQSNDVSNTDNVAYLMQESTEQNYRLLATLQNIKLDDLDIIEQNLAAYTIQISHTVLNDKSVSNRSAALFVNEVIDYLQTPSSSKSTQIAIDDKTEYKQASKAKCQAFGCDVCSFSLCTYVVVILAVIDCAMVIGFSHAIVLELCEDDTYRDGDYQVAYEQGQSYQTDCVRFDRFVTTWIVGSVFGIVCNILALFGLYYLKRNLLMFAVLNAVMQMVFCCVFVFRSMVYVYHLLPILVVVPFIIYSVMIGIICKTYFIMKNSVTVAYLKQRMNMLIEMEQTSRLENGDSTQ